MVQWFSESWTDLIVSIYSSMLLWWKQVCEISNIFFIFLIENKNKTTHHVNHMYFRDAISNAHYGTVLAISSHISIQVKRFKKIEFITFYETNWIASLHASILSNATRLLTKKKICMHNHRDNITIKFDCHWRSFRSSNTLYRWICKRHRIFVWHCVAFLLIFLLAFLDVIPLNAISSFCHTFEAISFLHKIFDVFCV